MPANAVKSPADEKKWNKAKSIVEKEYKTGGEQGMKRKHWAMTMAIYQDMKSGKRKEA